MYCCMMWISSCWCPFSPHPCIQWSLLWHWLHPQQQQCGFSQQVQKYSGKISFQNQSWRDNCTEENKFMRILKLQLTQYICLFWSELKNTWKHKPEKIITLDEKFEFTVNKIQDISSTVIVINPGCNTDTINVTILKQCEHWTKVYLREAVSYPKKSVLKCVERLNNLGWAFNVNPTAPHH